MRRPRAGDGHVPLQGYGGHQADGGHDGHVSHEGRHPAEVGAKHPVPAIQNYIKDYYNYIIILFNTIDRLARRFDLIKVENLLIFHKDKVEGAVEDCVDEVCQTQIEDEDVCDSSHLLIF